MAIVTHQDGYLQITEGHNWQDISEGSILQRIFRGWNERRLVAGLPLYWYGKNPNASSLLGGDAQFTEFENPLTIPNPTYTIEDARIYPGAVLQNVGFWKKLQEVAVEKNTVNGEVQYLSGITTADDVLTGSMPIEYGLGAFMQYPNGDKNSTYQGIAVTYDEYFEIAYNPEIWIPISEEDKNIFFQKNPTGEFQQNIETIYNLCGLNYSRLNQANGYIQGGDIINKNTINDLLKTYSRIGSCGYYPFATFYSRSGASNPNEYPQPLPQDPARQCLIALNSAANNINEEQFNGIVFKTPLLAHKIGLFFHFRSYGQFEQGKVDPRLLPVLRKTLMWYQGRFRAGDDYENFPVYSNQEYITEASDAIIQNDFSFNVSSVIGFNGDAPIWDLLNSTCATLSNVDFRKSAEGYFQILYQYQFADLPT
jgi:hypothetical protein